jgi:CheY-like chemotaxis protein
MTSAPFAPRVLVVDDHAIFRSGVRAELEGLVQVVGEAGTVADALELARSTRPDVVLLDVHMPDGGGLAVLRGIAGELPATRFLALSVSDSPEDVIELVRAGDREVVVYVHDRGPGFDIDAIPADRRGVRESIIARTARHGGTAAVHVTAGTGCEIVLTMAPR